MMFKDIYELPWIKPFARILGVIPISSEQRPREMIQSLQTASDAIRAGDVVCIFAEGQITRIGQLLPFRRGFERIMKDVEAPIIPVALDGVWGSIFSFKRAGSSGNCRGAFPYPVTVNFGPPLPPTRHAVRGALRPCRNCSPRPGSIAAGADAPLPIAFVRAARQHPFRFAMADAQNRRK